MAGKHRSGETKGQSKTKKHGQEPRRILPAPLCSCGSGISTNRCNCRRVRSGRDRIPTLGRGTTKKWGQR
jgi:hypothetical protein